MCFQISHNLINACTQIHLLHHVNIFIVANLINEGHTYLLQVLVSPEDSTVVALQVTVKGLVAVATVTKSAMGLEIAVLTLSKLGAFHVR